MNLFLIWDLSSHVLDDVLFFWRTLVKSSFAEDLDFRSSKILREGGTGHRFLLRGQWSSSFRGRFRWI